MADLQTAVADDDALDDELQDRLLVGERRLVQAGVNAITKRLQAGANSLGLDALATEVIALLLPGFKWSSQHLERGGCDGHSEAAFGSVRARRLALAGSALCCAA